jgi:hypothetical protein
MCLEELFTARGILIELQGIADLFVRRLRGRNIACGHSANQH